MVLAHALLDMPVAVSLETVSQNEELIAGTGVPLLQGKLDGAEAHSGAAISDGWHAAEQIGSAVEGMLDPRRVIHSRRAETCCWPKVFLFAARLRTATDPDALWGAAEGQGLGSVPAKWLPEVGLWQVGNRHRAAAALVAGCSLRARVRATQVCSLCPATKMPPVVCAVHWHRGLIASDQR